MKLLAVAISRQTSNTLRDSSIIYAIDCETNTDINSIKEALATGLPLNEIDPKLLAPFVSVSDKHKDFMPFIPSHVSHVELPIIGDNIDFFCEVGDQEIPASRLFIVPQKEINNIKRKFVEPACGVGFMHYLETSDKYKDSNICHAMSNGVFSLNIDEYDLTMGIRAIDTSTTESGDIPTALVADLQRAFDDYIFNITNNIPVQHRSTYQKYFVRHILNAKYALPAI